MAKQIQSSKLILSGIQLVFVLSSRTYKVPIVSTVDFGIHGYSSAWPQPTVTDRSDEVWYEIRL